MNIKKIKTEETAELLMHIGVLMSAKITQEVEKGILSSYSTKKLKALGYLNEDGSLKEKEGTGVSKYSYNKVVLSEITNMLQ